MDSPSWELKGAGNANLVFAYSGQDPELVGMVLRVRKIIRGHAHAHAHGQHAAGDIKEGSHAAQHEAHDAAVWQGVLPDTPDDNDTSGREEHYMCTYLNQWISHKYIPRGVPCEPPQGLLQSLVDTGVTLNSSVPVQVFLDHTLLATGTPAGWQPAGPTLCAEIKPKAGCMPPITYVTGPHSSLKARYPRYVMHALLKAVQGKGELNSYNPLDLFSSDPGRIRTALEALLAAPNNNLRLFLDGQLLWGASATHKASHVPTTSTTQDQPTQPPQLLLDPAVAAARLAQLDAKLAAAKFCGAAAAAAAVAAQGEAAGQGAGPVRDGEGGAGGAGEGRCVEALMEALQQVLSAEDVLEQVLSVQQQDQLDVEGAAAAYAALHAAGLKGAGSGSSSATAPAAAGSWAAEHTGPQLHGLLRGYLTATTAKDCGVMVALQRVVPVQGSTTALDPVQGSAAGALDPVQGQAAGAAASAAVEQQAVVVVAGEVQGASEGVGEGEGGLGGRGALPSVREAAARLVAVQQQARGLVRVRCGKGEQKEEEQHFMYKITLLDLDLKSVAKISSHAALDAEILACAAQHVHVLAGLDL